VAAKLTALQFFFALTWVVYVIYLPALAEQAGIERRYVPWILMMDQAIFIACDWAAGVYADRVGRAMARIGVPMAGAALASCAAFLALPWAAPVLGALPFVVLTAFWSVTSSALRAPSLALVSRHAPAPQQPRIAAVYLLGLGIATALAPYAGLALKGVDPRGPFAVASAGVALLAFFLARAERGFEEPGRGHPAPDARASIGAIAAFAAAALLFSVGFQVHFAINSAPAFARVAAPEDLPHLMPVFWIGFNLALWPATLLSRRFGGMPVMTVAGWLGMVALAGCAVAPSLAGLVAMQLAAGAAWGITLMAIFVAALEAGRPGHEGLATGVLFSLLAAAALIRLAAVSTGFAADPGLSRALAWLPVWSWALASAVVGMLALRHEPRGSPTT
jgi:hypothetical protein